MIAVAATTANDLRPCFSSTGPDVELAAPGTGINSTLLGGGYGTKNGTSMASPHVAGTAGLVIAAGVVDTNGNGIVDEVRDILTSTAEDLGPSGRDSSFGFGLVDAVAAVAAVGPPDPAVHVTLTTDKSTYIIETDTTLTATAVVADELGAAIGGLDSSAFVTVLDGVGVPAVFTETATPGTYTASGDLPAEGAYTLEVTVTSGLLVGTDSATFTVATAPPPGATATVASIEYSTSGGKNRDKHLDIKLTVVDGSDPVSGAVVSIRLDLNGSPYVSGTGTTGTSGQVTFVASNTPGGCYTTTVLDVVAAGLTWDGVIPVAVPSDPLCK